VDSLIIDSREALENFETSNSEKELERRLKGRRNQPRKKAGGRTFVCGRYLDGRVIATPSLVGSLENIPIVEIVGAENHFIALTREYSLPTSSFLSSTFCVFILMIFSSSFQRPGRSTHGAMVNLANSDTVLLFLFQNLNSYSPFPKLASSASQQDKTRQELFLVLSLFCFVLCLASLPSFLLISALSSRFG
jgi:hypothetical protein